MELAIARPMAPGELQQALDLLPCVQASLDTPIAKILRPPQTTREYRRNTLGQWKLTDVPRPTTPRQSADCWSRNMIDLLVMICGHLQLAQFQARYKICAYSCWGDFPESLWVSGIPSVTGRHFDDQIFQVTRRFDRFVHSVSRKQDVLNFALDLLETHTGRDEVFPCTDSRIRVLVREPNPIVVRARRENTGMCWSMAA